MLPTIRSTDVFYGADCKDGVMDSLPIDLHFAGTERSIGVYLVDTDDGPALFDCGPATTVPRLHEGLRERGLELGDLRHLLLSHIHFDHAGAAGALAAEHEGLTVWVSEVGAPHLVDPSRLERSARRLYGEAFDGLWGGLTPIPESRVRIAAGDVLGWEAFPTTGHASHHVSYFRDGTLLAGDAAGVRIQPAAYVLPVSPPPDIDVDAWHRTTAAIRERDPERLALIHFGVATDPAEHLDRLDEELDRWAERVRSGMDALEFAAAARADMGEEADHYDRVAPLDQSWLGLRRYWDKRATAA
jgi:glyoxylase-like metal-dependent hydrolase (beta-lactamase superfamily II)